MPCWEVRTQSIDMARIDPAILAGAMSSLEVTAAGFADGAVYGRLRGVSYRWEAGELRLAGPSEAACSEVGTMIRKAYTAQAFRAAASRAGFSVTVKADGKLEATRARIGG